MKFTKSQFVLAISTAVVIIAVVASIVNEPPSTPEGKALREWNATATATPKQVDASAEYGCRALQKFVKEIDMQNSTEVRESIKGIRHYTRLSSNPRIRLAGDNLLKAYTENDTKATVSWIEELGKACKEQ